MRRPVGFGLVTVVGQEEGTGSHPVILRPVDWHGAPFARLQALPKDAKPVTRWQDPDEAWTDVARGIRRTVEMLAGRAV
jgi:hypothetical protein